MAFTRLEPNSVNTSANFTFANVTATYFVGDGSLLTGVGGGGGGTNYSNANVSAYLPTYTGNFTAGNIIGNGYYLTFINGSNVSGDVSGANHANIADVANSVAGGNVSGDVSGANHANIADVANSVAGGNVSGQVANALVAGTVYSNAQPNITSVGTLISLNVTGNISSSGNIIGNGQYLTSLAGNNVTGQVANALVAGTVYNSVQPNITSTGTLTSLTVTGLLTATTSGVKTSNIIDSGGTNTISINSGTVGIIGNLNVGTGGSGNISATGHLGNGFYLSSVNGANVIGQVGNSLVAGTVYSNAQPNITSVGTLASLNITGNLFSNGWSTIAESSDVLNTITGATGNVTHDLTTGAVFYHSSISANFTANFSNVATTDNRVTVVTLILNQGGTAYYANACQIDGVSQTIKWPGAAAPTPTANRTEYQSFSLIRTSSAWTVTSQLASYG